MALRLVNFLTNVTRQAVVSLCQPRAYNSYQAAQRARSLTHIPSKEISEKLQFEKHQPRFHSQPPSYRKHVRTVSDYKGRDEIDLDDEEYEQSFEKKVFLDDFQYELESTRPRNFIKEADGVFDVYHHYNQMYKDRNTKLLPHLQPNNLKPYGSTDTLSCPQTIQRPKITYPIYDTFDSTKSFHKAEKEEDVHRRDFSTMNINSLQPFPAFNESELIQRRGFSTGEAESPPWRRKEIPGYCPMNKTPKLITKRKLSRGKSKSIGSLVKSEEAQVSEKLIEKHKKLRSKYKAKKEKAEKLEAEESQNAPVVFSEKNEPNDNVSDTPKYNMNNYINLNKLSQYSYRQKQLQPKVNRVNLETKQETADLQTHNEGVNLPPQKGFTHQKKQLPTVKSLRIKMPISILQSGAFPGEMSSEKWSDLQPDVKLAVPWPSYSETLLVKTKAPKRSVIYPVTMVQCEPITTTSDVPQRSLSTLNRKHIKAPVNVSQLSSITSENPYRLDAGLYSPDCRLRNVFNKKFLVKSHERKPSSSTFLHSPVLNSSQRTFATRGRVNKCPTEGTVDKCSKEEKKKEKCVCNVSIKKVQSKYKDLPKVKAADCPCPPEPKYRPMSPLKRPKKIRDVKVPKRICLNKLNCKDKLRADDCLVIHPKDLPRYVPKEDCCTPEPRMKSAPKLRRPEFKHIGDPPRPKRSKECTFPRADKALKVKPKDLPTLPLSNCPCPADPIYKPVPPLKRPKMNKVIQKRVCPPKPYTCEDRDALRADICLKIKKKDLPPYIPADCPCSEPTPVSSAPKLRRPKFKTIKQVKVACAKVEKCEDHIRSDRDDWEYVYSDCCDEVTDKIGKKIQIPIKSEREKKRLDQMLDKKNHRKFSTLCRPLSSPSKTRFFRSQSRMIFQTQRNAYSTYNDEYNIYIVKNGISATQLIKNSKAETVPNTSNVLQFIEYPSSAGIISHEILDELELENSKLRKEIPTIIDSSKNKYYSINGKGIIMNEVRESNNYDIQQENEIKLETPSKYFLVKNIKTKDNEIELSPSNFEKVESVTNIVQNNFSEENENDNQGDTIQEEAKKITKINKKINNSNIEENIKIPIIEDWTKLTVGTVSKLSNLSSILPQMNKYVSEEKEAVNKRRISTDVLNDLASKLHKEVEHNKNSASFSSYDSCEDKRSIFRCPPHFEDLQPGKKFIPDKEEFVMPPSFQDKLDPMKEDRCIREKLGMPANATTWNCKTFNKSGYKPLKAKDFQVQLSKLNDECEPTVYKPKHESSCKKQNSQSCKSVTTNCEELEETEMEKDNSKKLSLWERVVNYFKARPNCPSSEEFQRKYLIEEAEKAAERAGLCVYDPKKKSCDKSDLPKIITAKDCDHLAKKNRSSCTVKEVKCGPWGNSKSSKKLYSTHHKHSLIFLKKTVYSESDCSAKYGTSMYDMPASAKFDIKYGKRNFSSWRYTADPFDVFGNMSLKIKDKDHVIRKLINSSRSYNLRSGNYKDYSNNKISNYYLNEIANELTENIIDRDEKPTYLCSFGENCVKDNQDNIQDHYYEGHSNFEDLIDDYLEGQMATDCDYEISEKIKTENLIKTLEELLEDEPLGAIKNH